MITDNEDNCSFESMAMVASTPTVSCISCGYFGVVNEFDHYCMVDCSAKKREELRDLVGVQTEQQPGSHDECNAARWLEECFKLNPTPEAMKKVIERLLLAHLEIREQVRKGLQMSDEILARLHGEKERKKEFDEDTTSASMESGLNERRDVPTLTASMETTQKEVEQLKLEINDLKSRLHDAEQRLERKEKKLVEDDAALREHRQEKDNNDDYGDYFIGDNGKKIYYRDIPPVSPSTSASLSWSDEEDDDQEIG